MFDIYSYFMFSRTMHIICSPGRGKVAQKKLCIINGGTPCTMHRHVQPYIQTERYYMVRCSRTRSKYEVKDIGTFLWRIIHTTVMFYKSLFWLSYSDPVNWMLTLNLKWQSSSMWRWGKAVYFASMCFRYFLWPTLFFTRSCLDKLGIKSTHSFMHQLQRAVGSLLAAQTLEYHLQDLEDLARA